MKYAVLKMCSSSNMFEGELELNANAELVQFGEDRNAALDYIESEIKSITDPDGSGCETNIEESSVQDDSGRTVSYEINFDYEFDSKEICKLELIELK